MPSAEPEDGQYPATGRKQAPKRKRETPATRLAANKSSRTTPNAYSRRSPPRETAPPPADDGDHSPPRKLKRPAARATINREQAQQRERQREEAARKEVVTRQTTGAEAVADHYNAVPERGREWRSTESKIKGLRSLNNWVKSTLIQKFSKPVGPVEHMAVLDMACGKGGDLGKWEKAPQTPSLYVGCDIANVSIEQAQQRYEENRRRGGGRRGRGRAMEAQFYVQDTFGQSLAQIPVVRQVGFNPAAGPGGGVVQGRPMVGGFDVVSMMFALHYSFESERLARGMLSNVAGALKPGGRFIGVMPNSVVISEKVRELLVGQPTGKTPNGKATPAEKPQTSGDEADEDDDWDPEKPTEPTQTVTHPPLAPAAATEDDDDWDPEKPTEPTQTITHPPPSDADAWNPENPTEPPTTTTPTPATNATPATTLPPLTWGNTLYSIRLPHHQPLPSLPLPPDGVFRPPFGWRYHYSLEEAVDAPEFVVPFEAFRALAEEYGLELLYRKGFEEIYAEESVGELGVLAERMGVKQRGGGGCLVGGEEMEAAGFYLGFCFYKT